MANDPWDDALEQLDSSKDKGADGAAPDVWDQALAALPPAASAPPVEQTRGLARLAMIPHALATDTQNLLGLPAVVERLGNKYLPDFLTKERKFPIPGMDKDKTVDFNALTPFATGDEMAAKTGLGLQNRPDLAPDGAFERYGTAALGAIPNAAATFLTGGVGAVPAITTALGGALSAQAAKDQFPQSTWAPIVAGVVGSLGAGWATSAIQDSLAKSAASKEFAEATSRLAEAKDALVQGRDEAANTVAGVKAASGARLSATEKMAKESVDLAEAESGKVFEATAGQLGKSKTLQEAGQSLQAQARDWLKNTLPAKMKSLVEPMDKAIPAGTEAPLDNFLGTYSSIDKKNLINRLDLPDTLLARVKEQVGGAGELVGESAPLSWQEARQLRTALGDAMARPKIVTDIGEQNIKQLYSAITADLGKVAEQAGAKDLFTAFNQESTRLHQVASGPMGRIISSANEAKDKITPEVAASALVAQARKGGTELAQLRGEIPDAVDELAAAQLRSGGWDKLSPEAKSVLVGDPEHQAALAAAAQAREAATAQAKQTLEVAGEQHKATVAAAADAARLGKQGRSAAVRAATKVAEAAQAKLPPPEPNALESLSRNIKSVLAGGYAGNALAPWVLNQLGLDPHGLGAHALTIGGGLALPGIVRGAKAAAQNPQLLMIPATGVVAGENALAVKGPGPGK